MKHRAKKQITPLDRIIAGLERQEELQRQRLAQTSEALRTWRAIRDQRETQGREAA